MAQPFKVVRVFKKPEGGATRSEVGPFVHSVQDAISTIQKLQREYSEHGHDQERGYWARDAEERSCTFEIPQSAFPVDDKQIAYLRRAFDRQRDQAITSVQQARARIMAEAAKAGALQGGRMLLMVKEEYVRGVTESADKMVRLAFELTGTTSDQICDEVERGLRMIRDALSNDLRDFFQTQSGWSGQAPMDALGNDFLNETDKRMSAVVDDLRHGILGGVKLTLTSEAPPLLLHSCTRAASAEMLPAFSSAILNASLPKQK